MAEIKLKTLGHYRILSLLGSGSFATVYKAQDMTLGREVALKILHPQLLSDPDFVRQFENDARAAANLEHPHIVTVFSIGRDQGRLYIPMRYCPGGSLSARIKASGPVAFSEAVCIITQIASAMDYAHRLGFIHRDIKPSNILFDAQNNAVLADFGLVKSAEDSVVARSSTGGIVGTPAYIAPEIWDDQPATPATDTYALGCVLYEMLTGEVLFGRSTTLATMKAHVEPRRFTAQWPEDVPPGIVGVLKRALSPNPVERYQNAGELAAELTFMANQPQKKAVTSRRSLWVYAGVIAVIMIVLFILAGTAGLIKNYLSGLVPSQPSPIIITEQAEAAPNRTAQPAETQSVALSATSTKTGRQILTPEATPTLSQPTSTPSPEPSPSPEPTLTPQPTHTLTPVPSPTQKPTQMPVVAPATPLPLQRCPTVTGTFGGLWQSVGNQLGCMEGDVISALIAEESFEGGMMFWREPFDYAQAMVVRNNGTWQIFGHAPYVEGSPDFSCVDAQTPEQCPPTPRRGFGMMWCDIPAIRSGLGNALNCERGYIGSMQQFESGFVLQSDTGAIYVFYSDGTWERR